MGSDPDIQVPNLVSNHLTTGLLDYIRTTGRYASGINLFEKLRTRNAEVSSLLACVLISADEEVRAVSLLHEAIEQLPMDYSLLDAQASFCKSKGRGDLALQCAKRGVTAAPSEFGTWARLAEIYMSQEQWELALLTLNSCPMFTYQDKDAPQMPEAAARVLLPVLPESQLDEINDEASGDPDAIHPTLRKLHAAAYKGTFAKAYRLLTEITSKVGWDQLLKIRSHVFVMEEEYRNEKQSMGPEPTSRNASTTALRRPSNSSANGVADAEDKDGEKDKTDKDDGESEGESGPETTAADAEPTPNSTNGEKAADDETDGAKDSSNGASGSIEKPEHTVTSEEVKSGSDEPDPSHQKYTQFQNKRLCERWLDNLFMVHYEDLRVYTIWRTEMAQFRQQNRHYAKTPEEWEILGELAHRLHHEEEAAEAYAACLEIRFSPKAMKGILDYHLAEGNTKGMLAALIRLIAWQYRWYSEVSRAPDRLGPCKERVWLTPRGWAQFSPLLLFAIRKLIEDEGAVKIRSIIQAMSLPQPILDLTHHYAALCATFRSSGSDI